MKIYLERYYKSNVTNIWFIKVVENMIQSEETDMDVIVGISFSLGAYRNRYKKRSSELELLFYFGLFISQKRS